MEEEITIIEEKLNRDDLSLPKFFTDMSELGKQVQKINKPTFDYGQLAITNYLLWLILGELQMLNNKGEKNA